MNSNSVKDLEEEDEEEVINKKKSENIKNNIKDNIDLENQKELNISNNDEDQKNENNSKEKINDNDNNETIGSDDIKDKENNNKNIKNEENINYDNDKKIKINKIKFPNFITNNSLKICQCCNKGFNKEKKIPFLLKCNHIFCKKCLEKYFTDKEGIKCPIDGLVGKSLNDIKILYNFLDNKNYNNKNKNKPKITINKSNKNYITYLDNNKIKSKSNKELIRNNKKNLNVKNNYIVNTYYDKIKNFINNNNLKYSNSTFRKKKYSTTNSLNSKHSLNNNNTKRTFNKNSSYIKNNRIINFSKINNKAHSRSNLNDKYNININIDNIQNSESEEDEYIQNYCKLHPEQKITHFVEDTKELICIHCAFNKLKNNPNIQIKEIPEKCKEYLNDLDTIIENNQKCSQIIQNSLNDINENKENEEKKIIEIYEQLLNVLITNRNNFLIKIEEIYQENTNSMNKKLEKLSEIINIAEKLKEDFDTIYDTAPYEFNQLTQAFNKFIREINDKSKSDLDIIQYNFSHDELNKVIKYLNDFADVKTRKKTFRFDLLKNSKNNITIKEINNFNSFNNNNINSNINLFRNGINSYFKNEKKPNKLNFNQKNIFNNSSFNINKKNNISFRNSSNDINIKNNSLLHNSYNNIRFKFKYEDEKDNKYSTLLNNHIFNNYIDNNNNINNNNNNINNNNSNDNGSTSESINDTLNKYIASTNMIRDSLYNQAPLADFNISENNQINSLNNSTKKFNELSKLDKLEILDKYKIPVKKNK